jgi:hypothetical protein
VFYILQLNTCTTINDTIYLEKYIVFWRLWKSFSKISPRFHNFL